MEFNTYKELWETKEAKENYKTLRITPYGDVLTISGDHVARFKDETSAELVFSQSGWKTGQIINGWRGVITHV